MEQSHGIELRPLLHLDIRGEFDKFPDFFLNCRRLLNIQYVIAIHLMRWLTNFYDFTFKWTATAAIGIYPTKAWLSPLVNFKHAIWTWGRTICNKILFKTWKNATEKYGMHQTAFRPSCMNRASVFDWHKRFKEAGRLWGMMRGVGGVRKSIHQSWLTKGLELLCWGFKRVQEEIPWEETSTIQIGSVAFPPRQCTSPQIHLCHRLFDQDGHQDSSSPSL